MRIELNHGRNYLIKEKYYIRGATTMLKLVIKPIFTSCAIKQTIWLAALNLQRGRKQFYYSIYYNECFLR